VFWHGPCNVGRFARFRAPRKDEEFGFEGPGDADFNQPVAHPMAIHCHETHSLSELNGVLFCTSCGSSCVTSARNLKKACQPPTRKCLEALDRLERGLPPKSGMSFPH